MFKTEDRAQNQEHRQKPILEAKQIPTFLKEGKGGLPNNDPILVASAGSLSGLLNSPIPDTQSPPPVLLVLADPPTSADLAETIEVKFTPAIQAKAAELNHNPVKIYNWVRNNIEFVPTYGSIQGADMCLQTRQCNSFDTASLLIALLRSSGIHARYVYGTIELPIDKVKNWVGGFTDTNSALTFIASGGIPLKGITSGGKIISAQLEHAWVEAWIDMIPSLGAIHKQGDTWITLDASFKQYTYKPGIDFYADMAIGGEQYIHDYIYSNGINPETVYSPSQFYFKRFFDIYENKYADLWTWDIFGSDRIETSKLIESQDFEILFETLPYRMVIKGWINSVVPDAYRPKVNISLMPVDDTGYLLQFSSKVADIAWKEITLSFIPASDKDHALLQLYGNNIFSVPAYLLEMRPVLKVDGSAVITGNPVGLGTQIELMVENVDLSRNNIERDIITVGDYIAITMVSNSTEVSYVADKMAVLSKKVFASYGTGTVPDDLVGTFLYSIGVMYFHRLSFDEKIIAKNFQLAALRKAGRARITAEAEPEWIFGVPLRIVKGGISIDADRNLFSVSALDGNRAKEKDFMIVTGIGSSAWESRVFQILTGTPSISAATLLKEATVRNIPIYNVDSGKIDAIMPSLEVFEEVKQDIRNAVNAGKKVIVPKTNILYNGFNSVGYIIIDPATGSGAYMIVSGLAGGRVSSDPYDWSAFQTVFTRKAIVELARSLEGSPYVYGAEGYPDPKCGFDCSGFIHYLYVTVYGPGIWGTNPDGTYIRPSRDQLSQICTTKNWWHPYEDRLGADILFSNLREGTYHHTNIIDENIDYSWSAAGGPCFWPPWNTTLPGWDLPAECKPYATAYGYVPICKDSRVRRTRNEINPNDPTEKYLKDGHSAQICRPVP